MLIMRDSYVELLFLESVWSTLVFQTFLKKVSHFTFFILLYEYSPVCFFWNQVRGDYSFPSGSLLGSHSLPSGSTFGTSASPEFVSWPCIWTTFSLLGPGFLCSWRHTRVPSVIGAPRAAHFMAADFPGPWFMRWIAEKICGWKILAQVTFLGLDIEYLRWVASDFWVFVLYRVIVSVEVGGTLSANTFPEHHCIPGNAVHRYVCICLSSSGVWHQWRSSECWQDSLCHPGNSYGLVVL